MAPFPAAARESGILAEVLRGLRAKPKHLPCKLFYDERGSALFEEICELPEYYLTRAELRIMRDHAPEMAAALGAGVSLIELGSGSSKKTRLLLDHLDAPAAYVPIDISPSALEEACARLRGEYPGLAIVPIFADYTAEVRLPANVGGGHARRAVYFPGSTIGNFDPEEVRGFLRRIATLAGAGGRLLIGVDLQKDPDRLHAAYNDAQGVTAAFNVNLLARLNRELAADFDLELFEHRAFYDPGAGRIEMHLVSRASQRVRVGGAAIDFARGETICTEYSYKFTLEGFARLAGSAGFAVERVWRDPRELMSVQLLRATAC